MIADATTPTSDTILTVEYPKVLITAAGMAVIVVGTLIVAQIGEYFYRRKSIRDDVSDISDNTKDILRWQIEDEQRDERARSFLKLWRAKTRSREGTDADKTAAYFSTWLGKTRKHNRDAETGDGVATNNVATNSVATSSVATGSVATGGAATGVPNLAFANAARTGGKASAGAAGASAIPTICANVDETATKGNISTVAPIQHVFAKVTHKGANTGQSEDNNNIEGGVPSTDPHSSANPSSPMPRRHSSTRRGSVAWGSGSAKRSSRRDGQVISTAHDRMADGYSPSVRI